MSHAYLAVDPLGEATSIRRYTIREKILSLHDNYKIKDESDQDAFIVRSKLWTIADKILLEDMNGNALVKIEEELLHLHPTYKILPARDGDAGRQLALVKKKFSFREKFSVNSVYGEYHLEALDFLGRSITLKKEGRTVAIIKRTLATLADTYEVEIDSDEDHPFILALIIVLNQAQHQDYSAASASNYLPGST
ncbi:unnamed protein product [Rotaria sordida]|uniref:Uncharacterized protein n=1 Tax=Rotaria sordida TaxID=392033 RepID=A0A815YA13_9BILA|nr:unnamed protein product [Rotaria sordida]CAF1568094.1 unnamed protein product [Rotaria sordida]